MSGKRKEHPSDSSDDERDVDQSSPNKRFHMSSTVPEPDKEDHHQRTSCSFNLGGSASKFVQLTPLEEEILQKKVAELFRDGNNDPEEYEEEVKKLVVDALCDHVAGQDQGSRHLESMSVNPQVNIKKIE